MTKKILTILTIATLFVAYTKNSLAECDGFYLAGRVGLASFEVEEARSGVNSNSTDFLFDKEMFLASGAIGYRYEHFRAELEYIWRDDIKASKRSGGIKITDATFESYSYLLAVYYDFFPYSWFTPFISAGVGYTKNKLVLDMLTVDATKEIKESGFIWSLGAGISVKVTNRLNVDLGYRYFDMRDLDIDNGKTDVDDQEVYLGLRYVL